MTPLTKSSYIKIVLVILLCLLVCGTLTGTFGTMRSAISSWYAPYQEKATWTPQASDEAGSFSVDAASVHDLSINWLAGSLSIVVLPDEQLNGMINVTETSNSRVPLRWRNNGGRLEIDYGNIRNVIGCSSWHHDAKDVTISIPKSYAGALNSISLNAASGDYVLSNVSCNSLEINQASGKTQVDDCVVGTFSLSLASGSFDFSGSVADLLDFEQASGHSLFMLKGANPSRSEISIASGDVSLGLPSPLFRVELDKISGSFSSDYDLVSNGNAYYGTSSALTQSSTAAQIELEMVSGSCKIVKSGE